MPAKKINLSEEEKKRRSDQLALARQRKLELLKEKRLQYYATDNKPKQEDSDSDDSSSDESSDEEIIIRKKQAMPKPEMPKPEPKPEIPKPEPKQEIKAKEKIVEKLKEGDDLNALRNELKAMREQLDKKKTKKKYVYVQPPEVKEAPTDRVPKWADIDDDKEKENKRELINMMRKRLVEF